MGYLAISVAMVVLLAGAVLTRELADIVDDDPGCGCGCLLLGTVGTLVVALAAGIGAHALLTG